MRESIMLLSGPCARFDIVNARNIPLPRGISSLIKRYEKPSQQPEGGTYYFVEFAILHHHSMDNPEKTLI